MAVYPRVPYQYPRTISQTFLGVSLPPMLQYQGHRSLEARETEMGRSTIAKIELGYRKPRSVIVDTEQWQSKMKLTLLFQES